MSMRIKEKKKRKEARESRKRNQIRIERVSFFSPYSLWHLSLPLLELSLLFTFFWASLTLFTLLTAPTFLSTPYLFPHLSHSHRIHSCHHGGLRSCRLDKKLLLSRYQTRAPSKPRHLYLDKPLSPGQTCLL